MYKKMTHRTYVISWREKVTGELPALCANEPSNKAKDQSSLMFSSRCENGQTGKAKCRYLPQTIDAKWPIKKEKGE